MVEAQARLLGIQAKELHSFRFDQLMKQASYWKEEEVKQRLQEKKERKRKLEAESYCVKRMKLKKF